MIHIYIRVEHKGVCPCKASKWSHATAVVMIVQGGYIDCRMNIMAALQF